MNRNAAWQSNVPILPSKCCKPLRGDPRVREDDGQGHGSPIKALEDDKVSSPPHDKVSSPQQDKVSTSLNHPESDHDKLKLVVISSPQDSSRARSIKVGKIEKPVSPLDLYKADFPEGIFNKEIESYLGKKADSLNKHKNILQVSLLGHLAVALGGKKSIVNYDEFVERAILWVALISDGGFGKTATMMSTGFKELMRWQGQHLRIYNDELKLYETNLAKYNALEEKKREQEFKEGKPQAPLDTLIYTEVPTIESILKYECSVVADELRQLLDARGQYKQGQGNDQSILLRLWNSYGSLTKSLGRNYQVIQDPFICIVGGIQTELLYKIISDENINDGFSARFLMGFIDSPGIPIHPKDTRIIENSITADEKNAFRKQFDLFYENRTKPIEYKIKPDAYTIFDDATYEFQLGAHRDAKYLSNTNFKLVTYLYRIALLLHCIHEPNKHLVSVQTAKKAVEICKFFKVNAERAFNSVFAQEDEKKDLMILQKLQLCGGGPENLRKFKDNFRRQFTFQEAGLIIDNLIKKKLIKKEEKAGEELIRLVYNK